MDKKLVDLIGEISNSSLSRAPRTQRGAHFDIEGAPYKPLMLLVVFSRVLEQHPKFVDSKIYFEDVLVPYTRVYAGLYPDSTDRVSVSQAVQPFWKLGAGKPRIWELVPVRDKGEGLLSEMNKGSGHQVKSLKKLTELVSHAQFSAQDWELIRMPLNCEALVSFILASYFGHIDSATGLKACLDRGLH